MKNTTSQLDRTVIKEKTSRTVYEKYGVTAVSRIDIPKDTLEILDDADKFRSFVKGKERKDVLRELNIAEHTLYLYAKKYQATDLFVRPLVSQFEIEIADFLTKNNVIFIQGDRNIIAPKELDFFIPEYKIAIECCGIYWHSELSAGRDSNYHHDKFIKCKEKNIYLITIFEDEWKEKRNVVESIILNKLSRNKNSIQARKCKVIDVSLNEAKEFINKNHIQGNSSSSIRLGLEYENKLVAVMTFGKSRFNKKYDWELVRYCSVSDTNVVGGSGKLLSYFIKNYNPSSIVSYSDNRWFDGRMYEKLNFKRVKETIGYFYTDYKTRYNRIKFQKHKLISEGFDKNLSEWEIMKQRKFDRIWDCGQICWEFNIKHK